MAYFRKALPFLAVAVVVTVLLWVDSMYQHRKKNNFSEFPLSWKVAPAHRALWAHIRQTKTDKEESTNWLIHSLETIAQRFQGKRFSEVKNKAWCIST